MQITWNSFLFKFIPMSIVILAIVAWLAMTTYAQRKQTVGKSWPKDQRVSMQQINHESYDRLLKKYVDTEGRVDYKSWHQSREDRLALDQYLSELSRADTDQPATRDATLAFWINAYNAVTLDGILRVYPTTSIKKHTSNLGGYNIWKHHLLIVGDRNFSLNDIEHQVLRKMNEPRIHFAIVCASIGCPRLLDQAYHADKIQQQLDTNATDFFSHPRNLTIDMKKMQIRLSSILSWFGDDFGKTPDDQLRYISRYFPESARKVVSQSGFSIGFLDYDWNLNAQK